LRPKPENPSPPWFYGSTKKSTTSFEVKLGETITAGFEVKPSETVAAGFKAKPLETVAASLKVHLGP
jgi:hypothetical protein